MEEKLSGSQFLEGGVFFDNRVTLFGFPVRKLASKFEVIQSFPERLH